MVEVIRISQKAKDQLVWLKRQTGIKNWNVLCRWAFCLSLADSSPLTNVERAADSNVEMTWKTFSGKYGDVYLAMLQVWMHTIGNHTDEDLSECARMHIHRGVQRLMLEKDLTILSLLSRVSNSPKGDSNGK